MGRALPGSSTNFRSPHRDREDLLLKLLLNRQPRLAEIMKRAPGSPSAAITSSATGARKRESTPNEQL
jgi:hypothetical protein